MTAALQTFQLYQIPENWSDTFVNQLLQSL